MPLAFLVPAFLVGILAIGIPLLLHLRRRDRQKPTPFPSLMFLSRIPIRTERRRRITDWPLLLLRALVVLLLVAAFARPFLATGEASETGEAGLTVLALDRSASMGAEGIAAVWPDSVDAVLAGLPAGRRIAVVGFDAAAEVLVTPTSDRSAVRAALAALPAPGGPTRFGAGLRAAASLLAGESVPGEVVVVSDLQRTGRAAGTPPALPAGTVVRPVVVRPITTDNVGVANVAVEPVSGGELRRAVIDARFTRSGGDTARQYSTSLQIDGRNVGAQKVTLGAEGSAVVRFDTVAFSRSDARVEVVVTAGDGFPTDDRYVGVIAALAPAKVVMVVPPDLRVDETRFLEAAQLIGSDPTFEVVRTTALTPGQLDHATAVVLYDVKMPSGAVGERLSTWLAGGGGMVVWLGERVARAGSFGSPLIGAVAQNRERREAAVIGGAVLSHPALEAVREAGMTGFSQLHLRSFPRFTAAPGLTVLAQFDDGSPALVAGSEGAGRVAITAIPADLARGDFPLHPLFLPFVRGVLSWAAGAGAEPLAIAAGESYQLPATVTAPLLRSPDGSTVRVDHDRRAVVLRTTGFTELHDGSVGGIPAKILAVNLPASESDLAPMPADELMLGVSELAPGDPGDVLAPAEVARAREARQTNWRWLLLVALIALVAENLLASRGWRGTAPPTGGSVSHPGGQHG